jgi:CHASE2 domain-containing sensor protein
LFNGKSPLDSEKLVGLVSRIQDYHPAVIAMDFDTESEDWCRLDSKSLAKILPAETAAAESKIPRSQAPAPVIWAEIPDAGEESLQLTPVLGGRLRDFMLVGIPRFPVDADGVVRRYEEEFHAPGTLADCPAKFAGNAPKTASGIRAPANPGNPGRLWSFSATVIEHACKSKSFSCSALRQDLHHPVIFNFYGDRYRFPTIQSHEFIGPDAEASLPDFKSQREALLQNKIVLVGGRYNAARDVYATPLKEMAGVELIALAIQSDLSGGGIRETQMWLDKLADIVVGSLVVLVYYYYRRRPRFAISASLIGVPIIATGFRAVGEL